MSVNTDPPNMAVFTGMTASGFKILDTAVNPGNEWAREQGRDNPRYNVMQGSCALQCAGIELSDRASATPCTTFAYLFYPVWAHAHRQQAQQALVLIAGQRVAHKHKTAAGQAGAKVGRIEPAIGVTYSTKTWLARSLRRDAAVPWTQMMGTEMSTC